MGRSMSRTRQEGGAVFTLFFPLEETVEPQATAELRSAWTGEGARPHAN